MGSGASKQAPQLSQERLETLTELTKFSAVELKQMHAWFLQDFPNGVMTRQDFLEGLAETDLPPTQLAVATKVFALFDDCNTGQMDFTTYATAVSLLQHGDVKRKVHKAWELLDIEAKDRVTMENLKTVFGASLNPEDRSLSRNKSELKNIVRTWDKDGDGKLSQEEFKSAYQSDKQLLSRVRHNMPVRDQSKHLRQHLYDTHQVQYEHKEKEPPT
eukprot:NODE_2619_length_1024_cov_19.147157_g2600_i0.p1 GENE.NODE_2619_length_1024_cov_19.147157_g2600_i0~~NODE_2619_length_1024_cov_19.147157_g2600_i0.p1  ORF type:complete len:216 (-),score=61.30 NODE_2619_length_1024_cov_19.147157_g2600_i0:9-656(-)